MLITAGSKLKTFNIFQASALVKERQLSTNYRILIFDWASVENKKAQKTSLLKTSNFVDLTEQSRTLQKFLMVKNFQEQMSFWAF